ncbi:MAG: acyl-CoA ligase (AMP-forming), exosortase A system-associated [Burkholderiaceae bacterium]
MNSDLLHQLILASASRTPDATALSVQGRTSTYAQLATQVESFAAALCALGLKRSERVAVYLDKREEFVVSVFGAAAAGGVFVPVNPLLKNDQVAYILADCNVRVLVTSRDRYFGLRDALAQCEDLFAVVLIDGPGEELDADLDEANASSSFRVFDWAALGSHQGKPHRVIDTDMTAILYTSGSTGRPKGVVLSHRNMVAGAKSVASYLENRPGDRLLAVLPLSFDAGFSQLTTAFASGATTVLMNYLLPRDVINALDAERVTGLTAVPPLWIQLAALQWPASITTHLRSIANTDGRMPRATLGALRAHLPQTRPFMMYGLTEAFRSTFLPPEEVDRRPDSIGKAIPNAEILVLREDGRECEPEEPGELVHRGALVGMGYWNDAEKTAERYKPLPRDLDGATGGLVIPEIAVFSGDTVRRDAEGYLYFIGRRDEMIKTSGYRVSPTEVEEALYATTLLAEVAAFGVEHPVLGQAIVVIATGKHDVSDEVADGAVNGAVDVARVKRACQRSLPAWMQPAVIELRDHALPRNPNGKIDRKRLAGEFVNPFIEDSA